MLDTSDHLDLESEPSIVQQLQILKYLIEIWPKSQEGLWHEKQVVWSFSEYYCEDQVHYKHN